MNFATEIENELCMHPTAKKYYKEIKHARVLLRMWEPGITDTALAKEFGVNVEAVRNLEMRIVNRAVCQYILPDGKYKKNNIEKGVAALYDISDKDECDEEWEQKTKEKQGKKEKEETFPKEPRSYFVPDTAKCNVTTHSTRSYFITNAEHVRYRFGKNPTSYFIPNRTISADMVRRIARAEKSHSQKKRMGLPKPVFCPEMNRVFPSAQIVEFDYGISASAICLCCKDPNRTIWGYHWRFATKEEIASITE